MFNIGILPLFALFSTVIQATPIIGNADPKYTANDFVTNGCKRVIMVYARGSGPLEPGNIGLTLGPIVQAGLKKEFGNDFAMQGVDYPALFLPNFFPDLGTTQSAVNTMKKLITDAAIRCPNAKIAAGGYSQGTAVAAGAIEQLPSQIRERVGAAVLFGYTRNKQNKQRIPNYPLDRTQIYCAFGDLVCEGILIITPAHYSYDDDAERAAVFIAQKLRE